MTTIAVVDYGMGNLRSVAKAMEHVAPKARINVTSSAKDITAADRVVFPGQGAARDCMANLRSHELIESVGEAFNNKPFLGICMGLQVLFELSDENSGVPCLSYVKGRVTRFQPATGQEAYKIPHMGWNQVSQTSDHALWRNIEDQSRFYFVHSYYVEPADTGVVSGATTYLKEFCSSIARDNIFATQFHPEKSAANGLQLLKNFSQWQPV